jgi:hypothetical protein
MKQVSLGGLVTKCGRSTTRDGHLSGGDAGPAAGDNEDVTVGLGLPATAETLFRDNPAWCTTRPGFFARSGPAAAGDYG